LDVLLRINLEGNQRLRTPDAWELAHLFADHPGEVVVFAHSHQRDEVVLPGDGEHLAHPLELSERRCEFRNLVGLRPDQHDCGDHASAPWRVRRPKPSTLSAVHAERVGLLSRYSASGWSSGRAAAKAGRASSAVATAASRGHGARSSANRRAL